jgi:curved DNA-binding protein CbpA
LKDFYKILNVNHDASETEIKKEFRKLATIHHPDKNGGSKKSEETFKIILNAYETLSDPGKRLSYDIKYRQHFKKATTENTHHYKTEKNDHSSQAEPNSNDYQKIKKRRFNYNYSFWLVVLLAAILYFIYSNKIYRNTIMDKQQTDEQQKENRPQSGEIDFNK